LKLNRQDGRKKKLKKKINHCFFCQERLNGEKNIHHHPPRSFKEFPIKKKTFKVHFHCHKISYNRIYKHLLEEGYHHGEILQIIQIPGFRNKKFQEIIYKFPNIDLYRFLIFKKKISIQKIIEMIDNNDIMTEMEKEKNESNFVPNQIDLDIMILSGVQTAKRQISSFLRFINGENRYRL